MATTSKAEHWRSRAAEALATTAVMIDEEARAIMVSIVQGYLRLAEMAEKHEAPLGDVAQPAASEEPLGRIN